MDQVDLAQIGLGRVARDARAMLDGCALMRVAIDAEPRQKPDAVLVGFHQRVLRAAADCRDHCVHRFSSAIGTRRFANSASLTCSPNPGAFSRVKRPSTGRAGFSNTAYIG